MSSDCSWKCQWTGHTWWRWGACSREKRRHAQNNACQNLPGDNEVSSRDVYPQIGETSQVCRATVVMTSKVEPCHVEPCRPATRSCELFCNQLAASVDLSILVLYGDISAVRRQCAQHYSGSVVAETLIIHWYHTEGCCNNPNGMSLPNLSFFQSWVCQGLSFAPSFTTVQTYLNRRWRLDGWAVSSHKK